MKYLYSFFKAIGFCSVLSMMGCKTVPNYSIEIRNIGETRIYNAYVEYNEFKTQGGRVAPGRGALHLNPPLPIPDEVVVGWRTEDKTLHTIVVDIQKTVPKSFQGAIVFLIDNFNSVTVKLRPD